MIQAATSGKGSENSRERKGGEEGGCKALSAGRGLVLPTSTQSMLGLSWRSINMGGREIISPIEK